MDEYLTLLGTLLGATLGGIIGFAGAYLVERQRFKRERVMEMRDKIYGPMYMEASKTLENVRSFQTLVGSRSELMADWLFFTTREDLKSRWTEIMDRLEKYGTVRRAAELALDDAAKKRNEGAFGVSIQGNSGAEYNYIRVLMGKTMASSLDLKRAIFLKLAPQDLIKKEKEKWGENLQIEVNLTGAPYARRNLEEFETLYSVVLNVMENDPLYRTEKEQRNRLIRELEHLLKEIEPFVKPSLSS